MYNVKRRKSKAAMKYKEENESSQRWKSVHEWNKYICSLEFENVSKGIGCEMADIKVTLSKMFITFLFINLSHADLK